VRKPGTSLLSSSRKRWVSKGDESARHRVDLKLQEFSSRREMAGVALVVSQRRKHTLVSPLAKPPAAFCRHELTRLARHNQRTWPPLFASRLWNKLLASHGELPTSKRLYGHLICAAWLKKERRGERESQERIFLTPSRPPSLPSPLPSLNPLSVCLIPTP